MYLGDWENRFIVREDYSTSPPGLTYNADQRRWFDVLSPMLGSKRFEFTSMGSRDSASQGRAWVTEQPMFYCPADRSRDWNDAYRASSYGVTEPVSICYRVPKAPDTYCSGDGMSVAALCHDFSRVTMPDQIAFLGEAGHSSWYHVYADLSEPNCALEPDIAGRDDLNRVHYSHINKMNWLFFDGHTEHLAGAPHDLYYQVFTGVYRTGVGWLSNGTQSFKDRFYHGACPY